MDIENEIVFIKKIQSLQATAIRWLIFTIYSILFIIVLWMIYFVEMYN